MNEAIELSFCIEYHTRWGESLCLCGLSEHPLPLHTDDGKCWRGSLQLHDLPHGVMSYHYRVVKAEQVVRRECTPKAHCLLLKTSSARRVEIHDRWLAHPQDTPFFSSAFTRVWGNESRQMVDQKPHLNMPEVVLQATIPLYDSRYVPAICGEARALGSWNPLKALRMQPTVSPHWEVRLPANELPCETHYKLVLLDTTGQEAPQWEEGSDRMLKLSPMNPEDPCDRHYDCGRPQLELPAWRAAGLAVPLFSLRSEDGAGIGDFGDLGLLVDWAVESGLLMVQLLPINDTTMTHSYTDSYPYNAISGYALHPNYIDLRQLSVWQTMTEGSKLTTEANRLNTLSAVDYLGVSTLKQEVLNMAFAKEGQSVMQTDDFRSFYDNNKSWLLPYTAFCYLRDLHGTADFRTWATHSLYRPEEVEALRSDAQAGLSMGFHAYTQYLLHRQLQAAADYARSKGIVLKGDIPIGISPHSVEAWTEPRYFKMDCQAGAPPDDFATEGQNWGFPTYNWDVMGHDHFCWWKERLRHMAQYFDAYRIDHILGFFRIWEIPTHAIDGLLGRFSPALPFSQEELASYGFALDETHLQPWIDEAVLQQTFGEQIERAKQTFLRPAPIEGTYLPLPGFGTQREVEQRLATLSAPDNEERMCYRSFRKLLTNVLFVPDGNDPHRYHPRIDAWRTSAYARLDTAQRTAFDRLYHEFFYRRHNEFWRVNALKKLPAVTESTSMLPCGEDLGMIPACVGPAMNELCILSLEVERMPKASGEVFGHPRSYPYHSVSTFSTHDMSTLRGWWEELDADKQKAYADRLGYADNLSQVATNGFCQAVIEHELQGNSMLCVLALQDWLSAFQGIVPSVAPQEEQINVPANPRHYWRYRMPLTLETLRNKTEVSSTIRRLVRNSERHP